MRPRWSRMLPLRPLLCLRRHGSPALIDLVSGETARCRAAGRDRYPAHPRRCTVNGRDIGARMVEDGWAVSYGRDYDLEETRARSRSVGLWEGAFERPQDWRREHRGGETINPQGRKAGFQTTSQTCPSGSRK